MADLKISQFTPVTDPTDVTLAGYKGLDNVKLSADVFATDADISAVSDEVATLTQQVDSIDSEVSTIQEVIPNTASATNQLVDHDTMNSTVTSLAANYVTYTANGDAFPTLNDLLTATTLYHGGVAYTPTAKDYATVLVDPTAPAPFTNGTVRRTYDGAVWAYSFGINEQPLTADQLAAVNSNITAAKVATFEGYATSKQDTLTAGENITILNNVISASGGGGGDFIDKRVFIDTIRGTVGRNAHRIGSTQPYYFLEDGIMRDIQISSFNISDFVPDSNGMILDGTAHISQLRGLRAAYSNTSLPAGFLSGVTYEHFALNISRNNVPISSLSLVECLSDISLEYLHIANNIRLGEQNPPNIRRLCGLPNLNTIIIKENTLLKADLVTPSLNPDYTFRDIKNDPSCILYSSTLANAELVISLYPGLSNWTPKEIAIAP